MLTLVVELCDGLTHTIIMFRGRMPGALNGVMPQFRTFAVIIIRYWYAMCGANHC
jgi:hypothetical protein